MEQYIANVNYKLNLYRSMADAISENGVVQDIMSRQNEITPMNIMETINKLRKEITSVFLKKNEEDIYLIVLYTYNTDLPLDGMLLRNIEHVKDEEWFKNIKQKKIFYNYFFHTSQINNFRLLSIIRPIININEGDFTKHLGIVQVSLKANEIFRLAKEMSEKNPMEILILDQERNIIFNDNINSADNILNNQDILNGKVKNGLIRDGGKKKIVVNKNILPYGWQVVALFPYDKVESEIRALSMLIFLIVTVILIISVSLALMFSKLFTKRLHLLVQKMKMVEEGKLQITNVIEGNDEVGLLDRKFNNMVKRLKSLINENYIQRLEKREAELNALQLQINPHFLYNTLECISAIAAIHNCFDICNICQKLGDMFRYNINMKKNEFVSLKEEINHIQNYIYIQEMRFEGCFEVRYNIPEELSECKVLKFILQPIIENALNHGLDGKEEKGHLLISGTVHDNVLFLTVEDDGVGMPPGKVEELNAYINQIDNNEIEQVKKSIGLKNVNARIKIVYGDIYGVSVESQLNVGTRVTITLPYYRESKGEV
ncbi:MAG: sensor histidine kinase [Firmicutes bacterium]|nr:sensor histidine kinase [Bacillota bacterium]